MRFVYKRGLPKKRKTPKDYLGSFLSELGRKALRKAPRRRT